MIHQLPEGSIYVAIKSEPTDDDGPDLDPKLVDQYNRQVWTSQMYALAEIANRITYLINMKLPKSATPLEPYGPSAGTDKPVEKKKNVFDIMGYFGG